MGVIQCEAVAALLVLCSCGGLVQTQNDASPSPLPYTQPDSCRGTQIFQSGNLSCVSCTDYSIPSAEGLSCVCAPGAVRVAGDVSSTPHCTQCTGDQVSSDDGLYCVECLPPLVHDPATQSCSPCHSDLYTYMDTPPLTSGSHGSRECVPCPPGTWADQSDFSCVECGVDNCNTCLDDVNGRCFPSSLLPLPSPPSPPPFDYYDQHFTTGVGACRYGNQEACQLLINLCVLQGYLRSDGACAEVLSSSPSGLLQSPYYPRQGADEALAVTTLSTLHTSHSSQGPRELPLVVASYAIGGDFLGLYNVSDQLLICRDLPPRYTAAWQVGVQYEVDCLVDIASLSQSSSEPIFYDLYLHEQGRGEDVLRPIPVLPDDYVESESGEEVNRGGERGEWQLVSRFFLSEGISSVPRYARHMSLRVELDSNGHVFTPFLHINYATWEPDLTSTDTIRASFSVEYIQDVTSFNVVLSVFVIVLAILVGVVCGVRVNGFLRRSGDLCCSMATYAFAVAEFCAMFSSALFLLLSVSCTVILILYKGQTLFVYTLPTGSQLLIFQLLLSLALLCRVLYTVYLVWGQCCVDLFLIDWERPKGAPPTNPTPEQPSVVTPPTGTPVSIWRTYFIANEWNELQSFRRGSPLVTLFLALMFLQVAGMRHLAEHDPTGHVTTSPWRYSAPHSPLLRFSLTALIFTLLSIAMRLFMFAVYERFIEHKIHQFTDLCSVSNVSVFIMSHRCYGYYIEGRSVHGCADTNMREMNNNLHKEQQDMCGRRGLMPDSDLQTFQIALTQQFRMHYDEILTPLKTEIAEGQNMRGGARGDRPHPPPGRGASEASISTYEHMNQFLSSFISHSLRGLDYTTKTKVLVERVLDLELHGPVGHCLFYEDPAASFSQLLFYGQEWSLWQLEVLVFAFVDMLATDYVLATIITFLVSRCLSLLRDTLGRRNLKVKTLVDERFLI